MKATKDILDSIEDRLRELNREIGALNAARAALATRDGQPSKPPRKSASTPAEAAETNHSDAEIKPAPPRRPAQRKPRARGGRSVDVVPAGKLELLLSNTDGLTTSTLAERANADRDQVLTLLRELEAAGRVRRTGQRRGTRWHVITDEDRIRERAAELAARSRSAA